MKSMHRARLIARLFAGAILVAVTIADAQIPGSAFGAPSSSLHGGAASMNQPPSTSAPATPAWTPRNGAPANVPAPQTNAVQQANLPADLAKLNDNAIIIIGGKPTAVGAAKRAVLALDDKAIIIIGGKPVAAAAMKRDLQAASHVGVSVTPALGVNAGANRVTGAPAIAPPTVNSPAHGAQPATRNGAQSHAAAIGGKLTVVSPRRATLQRQFADLRAEQDRFAQQAQKGYVQPASSPARASAPANAAAVLNSQIGSNVRLVNQEMIPHEGIFSVNGRDSNVRLTPGANIVISGFGFGAAQGTVSITGGALNATPIALNVRSWANDTIVALLPATTRGVPDADNAALVVQAPGKTIRFDGVRFIAAREEQTIMDRNGIGVFVDRIMTNAQWNDGLGGLGRIGRASSLYGGSIDCPPVGTDTIRFHTYHGFDVVAASMIYGRTDSGDGDAFGQPGSRVFTPGYDFGDWINQDVTVKWGVFRSHTSPQVLTGLLDVAQLVEGDAWPGFVLLNASSGVPPPAIRVKDGFDACTSDWALSSITVLGPAGVAP